MPKQSKNAATIQIIPLLGLPEIQPGDDLPALIASASKKQRLHIDDGDVFVVAHKIVSKAEDRIVSLDSVKSTEQATQWATEYQKDPRAFQLILNETRRIVRMDRGVIIAETAHGFVCANAGVPIPRTCGMATRYYFLAIRIDLLGGHGANRFGCRRIALLADYRGKRDRMGKLMQASIIARADEIASAAELVMGKSDGVPVALVWGMGARGKGRGRDLIRLPESDLFH